MTNADFREVAPKSAAIRMSRINPRPRLAKVLAAITPAARASPPAANGR